MDNKVLFPFSVIDSAISLEELGIKELAWKWKDIHNVITFLVNNEYAILGGDVYLLENDEKIITYDNWYIDKETGTSWFDYVIKSQKKAIDYIDNYHIKNGDSYCYSIVYSKNRDI